MTTKEKNAMIRNIYRIIAEDGITSHIYRDGDWRKVYELRDIAQIAARGWCAGYMVDAQPAIVFADIETCDTCKRYNVSIEDAISGEVYGGGQIVAAFAGSVEEPWSAYDVCATWWAVSSKYDEALATINNALKKAK